MAVEGDYSNELQPRATDPAAARVDERSPRTGSARARDWAKSAYDTDSSARAEDKDKGG